MYKKGTLQLACPLSYTPLMIRLLLVDDQPLFREGLRTLLATQNDFEVVGEAGQGAQAVALANELRPDVILMDVQMPSLDGVAATRQIVAARLPSRIIMLTTFDDDENVFEGLRAGAVGYLLKDAPFAKLADAIRITARGESFLQPSIAAKVVVEFARLGPSKRPEAALTDPLSEREQEILKCLANGASNREIAQQLVLAEGTVKNHVTNILGKLGVRDRTQAALRARELGLL